MDAIDLHLDEDNELTFRVSLEGTDQADLRYQFVLEGDRVEYGFPGSIDKSGEITVIVPPMKRALNEGAFSSRLEVIVDDRIFTPLRMISQLKASVKIQAESVSRPVMAEPTVGGATLVESSVKTRTKSDLSPVRSKSGPTKEKSAVSRPQKRETIISEAPVKPVSVSPKRASGVDAFTKRLNDDKGLRERVKIEAQKLSNQGKTAKEIKKIINEKFSR
jgi:hypothetical protein